MVVDFKTYMGWLNEPKVGLPIIQLFADHVDHIHRMNIMTVP